MRHSRYHHESLSSAPLLIFFGTDKMVKSSERYIRLDPSRSNYGRQADFNNISHQYEHLVKLHWERNNLEIFFDYIV